MPADLYWDHDEADDHVSDAQMHYKSVHSWSVEVSSFEQGNENWKTEVKLLSRLITFDSADHASFQIKWATTQSLSITTLVLFPILCFSYLITIFIHLIGT